MTTAGARLALLAGNSGPAGTLLLLIGSGATAAEALVDYSGLGTATAAVHLMTDIEPQADIYGGRAARARKKRERDQQFIEIMKQVIISAIHKRLG